MTSRKAAVYVCLVALAAYLNSLGNGFAYDDDGIITQHPQVQSGDWMGALTGSWWPDPTDGAGLYRPVTLVSFVAEWRIFGGEPLGFHVLNVLSHGVASLLVFLVLLRLGSLPGALAGGVVFAVHPLHTEAVANVVGRAELYAAIFFLLGCLLYWRGRRWTGIRRLPRLLGLGGLYLLALGSKEIAVTLPGVLVLLELFGVWREAGPGPPLPRLFRRVVEELPVFLLLTTVLLTYLGLRYLALGAVVGELPAPLFLTIGPEARVLTALALWIQYLRLLLFPLDLAADYDPGVLFPSEVVDLAVVGGGLLLVVLIWMAVRLRNRVPLVSLGILWFGLAILPVSNLLFPTGVLLAERTLYLPSVGLSLVVAGLAPLVLALPRVRRRLALAGALVVAAALLARTVARNPTWMDSFVLQQVLNQEHPESWRAIRARAQGLERVGELEQAAREWDLAVRLAPHNYTLLVQAGDFHCRQGSWNLCEAYLRRAIDLIPGYENAYQLLSGHMIRRNFGREGHRIALTGLARSRNDQELWALVSESYIQKGDLEAAVRAREAAIAVDRSEPYQWRRLAEILEALGREQAASEARDRADSLDRGSGDPPSDGGNRAVVEAGRGAP